MSDQYIGEIRAFGFNFAPTGWFQCNGQTLPISAYTTLFAIIGTYYGGNGTSNFQLPNLQGVAPMHWGTGQGLSTYVVGENVGATTVTLSVNQIPQHNHNLQVMEGGSGATNIPSSTVLLGIASPGTCYLNSGTPNVQLAATAVGTAGGGQPHQNQQPYLTLNFCIAWQGAFPPRG